MSNATSHSRRDHTPGGSRNAFARRNVGPRRTVPNVVPNVKTTNKTLAKPQRWKCWELFTRLPKSDDDFDWSGEEVVIREQPATAIYFNPDGALVIRQRAAYPDDDPFIYIGADHIAAFLDRLCDVCGIPSVGKR